MILLGQEILDSHARAEEEGYQQILDTAQNDMAGYLAEAEKAYDELNRTDTSGQETQIKLADLRITVRHKLNELRNEFLHNTRHLSKGSQRRMLRRYGFSFYSDDSDSDEEEEINEVTPETQDERVESQD